MKLRIFLCIKMKVFNNMHVELKQMSRKPGENFKLFIQLVKEYALYGCPDFDNS